MVYFTGAQLCSNYLFDPLSGELTPTERAVATIASAALFCCTAGLFHLCCRLYFAGRKLSVLDSGSAADRAYHYCFYQQQLERLDICQVDRRYYLCLAARMLYSGEGGVQDQQRALRYFEEACGGAVEEPPSSEETLPYHYDSDICVEADDASTALPEVLQLMHCLSVPYEEALLQAFVETSQPDKRAEYRRCLAALPPQLLACAIYGSKQMAQFLEYAGALPEQPWRLTLHKVNDQDLINLAGSCPRLLGLSVHSTKVTDTAIEALVGLSLLQALDLSGCPRLTGSAMAHFTQLHTLTSLSLSDRRFSAAALGQLSCLTDLTALDISKSRKLDDQAVQQIVQLTNLTSLSLSTAHSRMTNQAALELTKLGKLSSLQFPSSYSMTPQVCHHLALLTQLTDLDIGKGKLQSLTDSIGFLHTLTNLRSLDLSHLYYLNSDCLATLSALTNLSKLILYSCIDLTDSAIAQVAKLTQLTALDLTSCNRLSEFSSCYLSRLSQLTSLDLSYSFSCSVESAANIAQLTALSSLKWPSTDVILPKAAALMATLPMLTELQLSHITDEALEELSRLTLLTSLDISFSYEITDTGMQQLTTLTHLTSLSCRSCNQLTDQCMSPLTPLTALRRLDLANCVHLGYDTVNAIKGLTNLTYLDLDKCGKLSDLVAVPLVQLTQLTHLNIDGLDSTAPAPFLAALPKLINFIGSSRLKQAYDSLM